MRLKISYDHYINTLILLFCIAVVFKRTAMDAVFLTASITGIYWAVKDRVLPYQISKIRLLTWLFWGYFITVISAIVAHPRSMEALDFLTRELYFLLAPFAAIAFIKAKLNFDWLSFGAKLGSILIGLIVLYEHYSGIGRPSGFLNANMFANLAVLLFFMVLASSFFEKNKTQLWLTIAALLLGGVAIIYTGGRSAWIAFILLMAVVLYLQIKQGALSAKKITTWALLSMLLVTLLGVFNQTLNQRASMAFHNVAEWFSGDLQMSSSGQRLEMIRIGLVEAPNIPFFGNGYRNINQSIITDKYTHEVHDRIRSYTQLHNAYLTNFVGGGYPLLLALLLNLFIPFRVFNKSIKPGEAQPYVFLGVLVALGYAIFGMFNNLFGDVFMNAFYTFMMAMLLPLAKINPNEKRLS